MCLLQSQSKKVKSKIGRSKEADMISDLETFGVMIGSCHYEKADSEFGNSVRRPESRSYDALIDHNSNSHSKTRESKTKGFAGNRQLSGEINSSN